MTQGKLCDDDTKHDSEHTIHAECATWRVSAADMARRHVAVIVPAPLGAVDVSV
jgi:hypothetical protein